MKRFLALSATAALLRLLGVPVLRRGTAPLVGSPRRERVSRLSAIVCVGGLAFSIYGLSGTAVAKDKPTVSVGTVKGVGHVLVDSSNKHTLYTLVNNGQSVDCTGACLQMGFAPFTVAPGTKPTAGKGVTGLGLVAGSTQVAVNGFPLFLFTADKAHQAKGQGMTSSGGTWHAPTVNVAKKKGGSNSGNGGVGF